MQDSAEREAAKEFPRLEAVGAQGGLSLDSSVSVVRTGRSEGGIIQAGDDLGDGAMEVGPGAARNIVQVEEPGKDTLWETAGKRKNKGSSGNQAHEQNRSGGGTLVYEQREGDWGCKTRGCEGFMNFRRRTHCMKCRRDKNGE